VQGYRVDFIIYEQATLRPIGLTELRNISYKNGTADYGILIGEKDCWDKGFGTEATILMLDYGFTIPGLHNIMLDTYSYNERAIRAYQRAGFHIIGRRREANRWGDKLYDQALMDCVSTEFHNPIKPIPELP
jgi:RimJ/RimL family protein N-acetyltransferase